MSAAQRLLVTFGIAVSLAVLALQANAIIVAVVINQAAKGELSFADVFARRAR